MIRPTRRFSSRRTAASALLLPTLLLAAAVSLSGCATPITPILTTGESDDLSTPGPHVTVQNCGTRVDFEGAPERVVTIKSTSTEMLLALGLGDRIVGTAFQDGPVPDEWAAEAKKLTSISDFMPSEEAVLNLEPDMVYSGWESAFAPDAAGDRAELATLGVGTYVQPAACRSAQVPDKLTFDEVFREITEVARIFHVDPTPLLDEQKKQLAEITPDNRGMTALWYSSGTDTPYVGGGTGAPQLVLDTVGLTNIAGDIDQTWTSLGWEAIVDADPDIIVLIDADWNTADSKIAALEANPATAKLYAVANHRYLILPFASSEAGVRTVSAAASLSQQLSELDAP